MKLSEKKVIEAAKKFVSNWFAGVEDMTQYRVQLIEAVLDYNTEQSADGLKEEIENYYGRIPGDEDMIKAARHFAEWGAKHLANKTPEEQSEQ